jgi:transposase, IS5 family
MKPQENDPQTSLFGIQLKRICATNHGLVRLAEAIDWKAFEEAFGALYCEDNGRPAKPIRLMVALHYLKALYGESDEMLVEKWVENPYWQYFCGEMEFKHEFPIEPTSMNKWRKRVKAEGLEKLLEVSIKTGIETGTIKREHLLKVNVDTTVQEKAITFPTDARLYHRCREKLVDAAKDNGVELRQTYTRKSKRALIMQSRYRHARQGNRANRELRKVKTYFGRVLRDLDRKTKTLDRPEQLQGLLELGYRLFKQKRDDTNKIYSLHAPEVECIAKGKAHKKYEFGAKVSVVASSKGNFVLGALALHGNPYDGHTLSKAIENAKKMIPPNTTIETAFVDLGYRGHDCKEVEVHVVKRGLKRIKPSLRRWMKRRSAIEPIIGHMKNDVGDHRNHLLGKQGDRMNALMMASGFNIRKILRKLYFYLFNRFYIFARIQRLQF